MSAKVIRLSNRRPSSPTRTYVEGEGSPFINREPINPPVPEKPHPVYQAARAVALSRMATADLTRCQRREALLKAASLLATCPRMKQAWQNKADQTALSISAPYAVQKVLVLPVDPPRALWPWLLVGLAVALALAVSPPLWVSL